MVYYTTWYYMYILYMYMYVCMYIHVCMCMYAYVCMYVHVCMYMYVHIHVNLVYSCTCSMYTMVYGMYIHAYDDVRVGTHT